LFVCLIVRLSAAKSSGVSGRQMAERYWKFVVNCLFVCAVECSGVQRCEWPSDGGTLLEVCGELFVCLCG